MNIKTISVNYERKFNLGNYQSLTLGCTAWADLDVDTDDPEDSSKELWEYVKENVRRESLPYLKPNEDFE